MPTENPEDPPPKSSLRSRSTTRMRQTVQKLKAKLARSTDPEERERVDRRLRGLRALASLRKRTQAQTEDGKE